MLQKRINADDFGISQGVNKAIITGATKGILNATSVMVNMPYAFEKIEALPKKDFSIGLHINLTNGKALSDPKDIPLLVDQSGTFKNGFVRLFLLGIIHPQKLYQQSLCEIRAQLNALRHKKIKVGHLDSHRHVHMIPALFEATLQVQRECDIPHLRIVNENIFKTIHATPKTPYLWDGGLIKYGVLWGCFLINKILFRPRTTTYFYSILNTCKITPEKLKKVKVAPCYDTIEIAIHPGMPEIDKKSPNVPDQNILSAWRTKELETTLHTDILKWKMR